MNDSPKGKFRRIGIEKAETEPPSATVIPLRRGGFAEAQPDELSASDALRLVRILAAETKNIVLIPYGKKRAFKRSISRRQIELCIQKGTITEGPFVNLKGHWQMNFYRHAAGEEITCVVAIDWITRVLVINTF